MNQSVDFINSINDIDIVQIHRQADKPAFPLGDLLKINKPIWCVVLVSSSTTATEIVKEFESVGDYVQMFLLDTPKGTTGQISSETLSELYVKVFKV
jgi:phosphoribosylanthranilate isomerase